jgi:alkanesulfonate monooxygenase SsuD/methylene tetrahydromethanopterin reductase-like flavin-dependent oxidoreductase (luciferase family)
MLPRIKELWEGDEMGPPTASSPKLMVGGAVDAAFARAARYGDGWIAGGVPPDQVAEMAAKLDTAWKEEGRDGEPRRMGLCYFALGNRAEEDAWASVGNYYSWLGEETAGYIVGAAAKDADTVQQYISAYAAVGLDELIMFPSSSDPDQVDLLADAAGL